MPINWNSGYYNQYGTTYTLAGVIQGEASSNAGQFAVASTIQNRMDGVGGGYVGAGSGNIQSVVTPSQFNGWQPPTAQSMAYAQAIQNGNLSQYGDTGNATFYAAPSRANASWANPDTASGQGLFGAGNNNVGGNYYSDNLGPPSSNFRAPQLGQQTDAQLDHAQDMSDYGYNGGNTYAGSNSFSHTGSGDGSTNYMSDQTYDNFNDDQNYGTHYDGGQTYTTQNGAAQAGVTPIQSDPNGAPSFTQQNYGADNTYDGATGTDFNTIQGTRPDGLSFQDQAPTGPNLTDRPPSDVGVGATTAPQPNYQIGSGDVGTGDQTSGAATPNQQTPVAANTTQADAGSNSSSYAGDMDVPPALDTVARSIAASADSENKATASAANTINSGFSNLGQQVATGAQTTASATQSLAQTVASSTTQGTSTLQDIKTTTFSFFSNIFVRGFIAVLGLIFVAAALHAFGATQGTLADPVANAKRAGRVARRAAPVMV